MGPFKFVVPRPVKTNRFCCKVEMDSNGIEIAGSENQVKSRTERLVMDFSAKPNGNICRRGNSSERGKIDNVFVAYSRE